MNGVLFIGLVMMVAAVVLLPAVMRQFILNRRLENIRVRCMNTGVEFRRDCRDHDGGWPW